MSDEWPEDDMRLLIDELQSALRNATEAVPRGHIDVPRQSYLDLADEAREKLIETQPDDVGEAVR